MEYTFGKSFTYTFCPTIDDEPFNLPTQTPSIYVFDEYPQNIADCISGEGAILDEITTWTESATRPYKRTIIIPPIADPDPENESNTEDYWIAINFILEAGGAVQTKRLYLTLTRIESTDGVPGTTKEDLKSVYPAISAYASDAQLDSHLINSEDEIKIDLQAKGLEWHKLMQLHKLKLALAYKTIANVALSQRKNEGDKHDLNITAFTDKYDTVMKSISLPYTNDKGEPISKETPGVSTIIISR